MKPYKARPKSRTGKLLRRMQVGREYTSLELAELIDVDPHEIHKILVCPRMAGLITSETRPQDGVMRGRYTLAADPEFIGDDAVERKVVQWRGGKAKAGEVWPVGPCVDFSSKYNVETFYGAA